MMAARRTATVHSPKNPANRAAGIRLPAMARPPLWDDPMARPASVAASQNMARDSVKAAINTIAIQTSNVTASAALWPSRSCQ